MGRPAPDPDLVVRAWELATGRGADHPTGNPMSVRAVASHLGISKTAASEYIAKAHDVDAFVDHDERDEARFAQARRLAKYLRWIDEQEEKGRDKLELIAAAKWIEDRWAKLAGLDAPIRTQVENTNTNRYVEPSDALKESVRRSKALRAAERAAILEGTSNDDNGA